MDLFNVNGSFQPVPSSDKTSRFFLIEKAKFTISAKGIEKQIKLVRRLKIKGYEMGWHDCCDNVVMKITILLLSFYANRLPRTQEVKAASSRSYNVVAIVDIVWIKYILLRCLQLKCG